MMLDRGRTGLLPRPPTLETESYLGFMESVRNHAIRGMFPGVAADAEAARERAAAAAGPALRAFVREADAVPRIATWKRLMRSQQQHTWARLQREFHRDAAAWEAALDAAERARPGRLHYDPDFVVPAYASLDIHLQPGGYVGDPLAGYLFHHGTKVFYQGDNDQDELHRQVVDMVRVPEDGQVRQVLDVACSIGQCTTALKQRFPGAQVTGLDVGLPLLRYANLRAGELGIDVQFVQALAEDTRLPDGQFDVVLCYILFHEVPSRLFAPILAEAYRLLRPGGTLTVVDAPNAQEFPAGNQLWLQFDAEHNCEPYSPAFVASDLGSLLRGAGFEVTSQGPTPTFLWCTTARRPAP
jgi:2-polyprenyl-3-methyl-5-hydroxy-6-metoxy-1,4-benzoquinol methylase